jgi:RNA polymerase sigma-70 factor, ECF subfamily
VHLAFSGEPKTSADKRAFTYLNKTDGGRILPVDMENSELTVTGIYEEFKDPLRYRAINLTRDSNRADDLIQETFIRAMRNISLLKKLNHYQLQAWLYRVLMNIFIDQQRARKREQKRFEELLQLAQENDSVVLPLIDNVVMQYRLFDVVPIQFRELLYQHYVLGMTGEEIGRQLGVPAATVRSRLHLALKWLRAHQSEFI